MSPLDRPLALTVFPDAHGYTAEAESISLHELAPRLRDTSADSKAALPWLKLARFSDVRTKKGSLRNNANVEAISGVEADYDGGRITPEEAAATLALFGLAGIVYTSPSNKPDAPRWRCLCPTSQPLPPEARARLIARLNGVFGGEIAGESHVLSQAYYFGSVKGNTAHRVIEVDGRAIDEASELQEVGKRGKTAPACADPDAIAPMPDEGPSDAALVADLTSGISYHEALRGLAARYAGRGMRDIAGTLRGFMEAIPVADRDARWRERVAEIPGLAESAAAKFAPAVSSGKVPTIRMRQGDLPGLLNEAERAMLAAKMGLYQRGGLVVQLAELTERTPDGAERAVLRVQNVCDRRLVELWARAARWERTNAKVKLAFPIDPPIELARHYLARAIEWKLPVLNGVIYTPTLRSDGTLLDAPGYDARTGLYLHLRGAESPNMPANPTRADAADALNTLVDLTDSFPYADEPSKGVALSAIVSAVVRPALPAAPLHAITATTFGTGKSYLTDIVAMIATGGVVAPIACGATDEELEKRLASELIGGKAFIVIDNVDREINGPLLAQTITQPKVNPRRLGKSENVEVANTAFLMANGNNFPIAADLARRVLLCALDAKMERPELRTFYTDPMRMVRHDRGQYVAAALTIVRAYLAAGMPGKPKPIGGFEVWSAWVRGALMWLGVADPALTMETVHAADPEHQRLVAVMATWDAALGSARVTARDVITAAIQAPNGEFREALLEVAGDRGAINGARLGTWLRSHSGRIANGLSFQRGKLRDGSATWFLDGDCARRGKTV